jgi:hypothetical protein
MFTTLPVGIIDFPHLVGIACPRSHLLLYKHGSPDTAGLGALSLYLLILRWVLWFFKNDRSRAWQDNLQLVTKFNTVEDFWA